MRSTENLPLYASRMVRPTGLVVPNLGIKRSLVLDKFNAEREATRSAATQRDRHLQQRAYAGANTSRLTSDWVAHNTSADSELAVSGRLLRARSRELVRDNAYALHCVRLMQNNIIGNGIGLQAQVKNARGKLVTPINNSIEEAHAEWSKADSCHTGGLLSWCDIERVAIAELVTAGEVILRFIDQPFGRKNEIPLAVEVIEADRLLDNYQTAAAPNGNAIRMGVEVDRWHRPVAYWFNPNHPGDYQFRSFDPSSFLRVPAEQIVHLYVINRWPQTRGEPWFHASMRDMNDTGGFEEAEIVKARASANVVGFIKSPEPAGADAVQGGRSMIDTAPGTWQKLLPGEEVAGFNATTANPAVEGFLRHMLRKQAVGVGLSYEAYSRDLTNASYSSARIGLLDDRDLYRVLQGFVIRNLRVRAHERFMDAATLVGKVKTGPDYYTSPAKYQAARFKPRGWSWIDPTKEVQAYKAAVRAGFMTVGDVIAQTNDGQDIEDVWKTRREELDLAEELDLVLDTDPEQVNDKGQAQAALQTSANLGEAEPGDGNDDPQTDDAGQAGKQE